MISKTAIIYPNVTFGANCVVEDFAVIGAPPRGHKEGELETAIGDGAVIRSHAVIYAGNKIGKNFQTGNKVNIRELNEIGDNVSIGTLSVVEHHVKIEDGVRVHTQAFVPEFTVLEEGCWIGPNVVITNASHPNLPTTKDNIRAARHRGRERNAHARDHGGRVRARGVRFRRDQRCSGAHGSCGKPRTVAQDP